jgi:hypothetical protein
MHYIVEFVFDGLHRSISFEEEPDGPPVLDMALAIAEALDTDIEFERVRLVKPSIEILFGEK